MRILAGVILLVAVVYVSAQDCGGKLKGPNGTFTTPNWPKAYPRFTDCSWSITVGEKNTIELEFLRFQLQPPDRDGCFDFVKVIDGDKTYGPYCDTAVRKRIQSETNKLQVIFSSDLVFQFLGFKAYYEEIVKAVTTTTKSYPPPTVTIVPTSPEPTTRYPPNLNCGYEQIGNSGFISSPMFPDNYPNEADCAYFIELEPNTTGAIKLKFLTFELESSENCKADSLRVHDGENGYAPVIANLCGNETVKPIITSGKAVFFHFVTDVAKTARGFNITWERPTCEEAGGVCAETCQYGELEDQHGTCQGSTIKCCKPPPTTTPTTTLPPICGKRFVGEGDSVYIIGGSYAKPNSWPWMLSLNRARKHFCGAVLLSDEWAVTSARCVNDYSVITVVAGEHDQLVVTGDEVHVTTSKIIKHKDFVNAKPWPNDLALLKLSRRLKLGPKIFPACFPQIEYMEFLPGDNCYFTGWGQTLGTKQSVLNELAISPVPDSMCSQRYGLNNSTKICAGNGTSGGCHGDDGGPLVCKVEDKWFLAGVLSAFPAGCNQPGYPSVFTRVSLYKTWVDKIIRANGGY